MAVIERNCNKDMSFWVQRSMSVWFIPLFYPLLSFIFLCSIHCYHLSSFVLSIVIIYPPLFYPLLSFIFLCSFHCYHYLPLFYPLLSFILQHRDSWSRKVKCVNLSANHSTCTLLYHKATLCMSYKLIVSFSTYGCCIINLNTLLHVLPM